jgi:hypothetical protein
MTTKEIKIAENYAKIILKHEGFKGTDKQVKRCIKMHRNNLLLLQNRIDNLTKGLAKWGNN